MYLTETAQKYKLYRYVRFASEVSEAKWDDATSQWHIKVTVAQGTKEYQYTPEYTVYTAQLLLLSKYNLHLTDDIRLSH